MSQRLVSVELQLAQQQFIKQCFGERGGGSADVHSAILNTPLETSNEARAAFGDAIDGSSTAVGLEPHTWRVVYDVVHATVYALGPFELPIVTGFSLEEAAEVNLRICVEVWGAYGGMAWDGTDLRDGRP